MRNLSAVLVALMLSLISFASALMAQPPAPAVQSAATSTSAPSTVATSTAPAESRYARAEGFLAKKDYLQAIKECQRLIAQKPDDSYAKELLESARRIASAEEIRIHYERADAYFKKEMYQLAIEEWKWVLEIDSTQDAALRFIASAKRKKMVPVYAEAQRFYEQGNFSKARDVYVSIMTQNPTDIDVERTLGRLNKVQHVVQSAEDAGPVWDVLRKALSRYISDKGNVRADIVAVRYAVELEPQNERIVAIKDFIEQENISEARFMDLPPKGVSIIDQYLNHALNYIYDGRFDLAIQQCEIVLAILPQNVLALKRLGSAYFAMNEKAKAREIWEKALSFAPHDPELPPFIAKTR